MKSCFDSPWLNSTTTTQTLRSYSGNKLKNALLQASGNARKAKEYSRQKCGYQILLLLPLVILFVKSVELSNASGMVHHIYASPLLLSAPVKKVLCYYWIYSTNTV